MEIQNIIRKRIFDSDFAIYCKDKKRVDIDNFRKEYQAVRNYLFTHHLNSSVAIMLPKDTYFLMTMLACMESTVKYVPIREDYPQSRVEQIREETKFDLLITQDKIQEIINNDISNWKSPTPAPEDTLYTICTSGSTGKPKAVVVPRRSIIDFWNWCDDYFSTLDKNDRLLQVADFTFDISLIDVGLFLYKNVSLYFSNFKGNIFTLALELEENQITFLNTVVNNFNMLLEDSVYSRANLSSLRSVVMGGARFTTGLYNKCAEKISHVEVNNLYGVTEVPVYSHAKRMSFDESDIDTHNISVGSTLGSTTAVIIKDGKQVKRGEVGELILGGGQLMREYANDPQRTQEVFLNFDGHKYSRTGDLAYQNKRGDYFIVGRVDDTIKYRGYRINLLDIDSYILNLEFIDNAVTFAVENELTQNTTICYIKLKEEKTTKEIKAAMNDFLLDYQIPEKIVIVDSFPLNDNGKICKKTLKSYHLEGK